MAVDVKTGATFEAGIAQPLFETRLPPDYGAWSAMKYDVSADEQVLGV